ncbi:MAG: hypothetical protein KA296_04125 [Marinobacter sp.]|nr:hypothetical protein [Marinobacter sp.]
MFKKTLISLAVASSLGLTGCFDSAGSGKNANPEYKINNPAIDGKTWPLFNPLLSQLPIPNDLIFDSEQGDGTFGVNDSSPPVTTALNELSGASTVAPAVIQFNGQIDPATVVYGETVFLLELEYASGDPLQGLSIGEPPTVVGPAPARADVETLDGTSAIRILPLQPLNPRKRYVAVVTKDITDINGENIIASPSYGNLTDEEQPLGNSGLAPVRTLINSLWEPIAGAALGITDDNIAITYSFTTSNDEKVLQYIAEPAAWFSDQITTFVKISATKQALEGGATSYDQIAPVANGAVDTFPASLPPNPDSPLNALFGPGGPCETSVGQDAIDCVGVALASNFADQLPTPLPGVNRTVPDGSGGFNNAIDIDNTTIKPVGLLSAVAGSIPGSDTVLAAEGSISLPYYLGSAPAELAGPASLNWVADDALAQSLNETFSALGVSIPQADASVSTAVNYVFPFPKQRSTQEVPVLTLYPNTGAVAGVVLFQHGITTDRSTALTFGTALAGQGYVVVAIDQPLHGVTPFSADDQLPLAIALLVGGGATQAEAEQLAPLVVAGDEDNLAAALGGGTATPESTLTAQSLINTVANAGSTIPGLAPGDGERHFGLFADASGTPAAMSFNPESPAGADGSGSLFINLQNFLGARDNLRQSAVDQMNLRATLFGLPGASSGLELPRPDTAGGDNSIAVVDATTPAYFAGHSLGTITGMPFTAAVNANQIADTIYTAADFSSTLPSAFNDIASASMLTPGGGVVRLLENSPAFAPRILFGLQQAAGLTQGDANLETYFNVLQAAIDSADPINVADNLDTLMTPVLLSEVAGDAVIPNAADEQVWGIAPLSGTFAPADTGLPVSVTVNSFSAPLAGTKPLTLSLSMITTYEEGDHGTPASANNPAVFGGMVCETLVTFGTAPAELPAFCTAP